MYGRVDSNSWPAALPLLTRPALGSLLRQFCAESAEEAQAWMRAVLVWRHAMLAVDRLELVDTRDRLQQTTMLLRDAELARAEAEQARGSFSNLGLS